MANEKPITLYYTGTPNGKKISIALEEFGLEYNVHHISLRKNEQKEPWYLKINPNGRIPAIVDHTHNDFNVFESGAILIYLGENHDPEGKLLPKDPLLKSRTIQWVMFQMAGVGPMQGQAYHFLEKKTIPYGIERYRNETKRLYSVLENQLKDNKYLIGDQFTIADICTFPSVSGHNVVGISLDEFPNLQAWVERIEARDAVKRALNIKPPQ